MSDTSAAVTKAISEALAPIIDRNEQLEESLSQAMLSLKLEDRGWLALFQGGKDRLEGFDLDEVKEISAKLRERLAGGSLYSRGLSIHMGYVFGHGFDIPGTSAAKNGAPSKLRKFYLANRDTLFGPGAWFQLQATRYTDGNIFVLCQPGEPARIIPLKEIEGIKVNPDFPSEVWAYLRKWTPDTSKPTEVRQEWYYTKRFTGPRQKSYAATSGDRIPVGKGLMVDFRANLQSGWVLGVPDLAPAAPWIQAYDEVMAYGRVVSESLSKLVFKVVNPTKKAAQNASAKVAGMAGHGNTASMVDGTDIQVMGSATKGYEYDSARPLAAEAAAGLNVSVMELLSDVSAASGSYGSAQALAPSVQNAMLLKQREFSDLFFDIFEAYDITPPEIQWPPIVEPDFYRLIQGITLASPALSDEEYRGKILDVMNLEGSPTDIPPSLAARTQAPKQAASPDQGRNSPSGGVDSTSKNDLASEALKAMQLDEMRQIVDEFRSIAATLKGE